MTSTAGLEEVGRFEEESVQRLCEHSGYRGFMLLGPSRRWNLVTITYWDTEEAMRACEDQAAQRAYPSLGGAPSVERLQLVREG